MNNIKWQAAREAQCLSKLAAYDNQTLITNNTNKKETIHRPYKQKANMMQSRLDALLWRLALKF